ncbi:hypothetical protein [Micropruina sp.]|uniref:hypothetical protein n=1 Tax=Micropruina sp. TaxID=2737536 RepID=UPI0039E2C29B
MSDLEELLRTDLRDAADTLPADLDVDELLDQGHRLRRARTGRRSLAAVAAAVVVSLAGWAGLAHRTTTGVPDPASTPTMANTVSFFTFDSEPGNVQGLPYASVTATAADGTLTLTARKRKTDPPVQLASVPLNPAVATGTPISPRLSLWVIPGQVDWVNVETKDPSIASYFPRHGFISSVGVTVVVTTAEREQKSKDWVDGAIWRATDGTLHSSAGTTVDTAVLSLSDTTLTVYRDPGLKVVSFFDAKEGQGFTSMRDDHPARYVVKTQIAREMGADGWEQFAVGILSDGARDPRVTTSAKNAEVVTGTLQPGGAVVFLARNRSAAEPKGGLITKVTYIDADGQTRSYRP